MATPAQLKALRKKHGLGEFSSKSRARARRTGRARQSGSLSEADSISQITKIPTRRFKTPETRKGGQVLVELSAHAQQLKNEIYLDRLEGVQQ